MRPAVLRQSGSNRSKMRCKEFNYGAKFALFWLGARRKCENRCVAYKIFYFYFQKKRRQLKNWKHWSSYYRFAGKRGHRREMYSLLAKLRAHTRSSDWSPLVLRMARAAAAAAAAASRVFSIDSARLSLSLSSSLVLFFGRLLSSGASPQWRERILNRTTHSQSGTFSLTRKFYEKKLTNVATSAAVGTITKRKCSFKGRSRGDRHYPPAAGLFQPPPSGYTRLIDRSAEEHCSRDATSL